MSVNLTDHERELLELLVSGASNKQAAKKLGIALRTTELHRQKLMLKLGTKSAAQLGYVYCELSRYSNAPASWEDRPKLQGNPQRRLAACAPDSI